jgi:hypothetical protein
MTEPIIILKDKEKSEKTEQQYVGTLTSFCGADATVFLNDKPIGEIQHIDWGLRLKKKWFQPRVIGNIICTVFDRMAFDPTLKYDIKIKYMNEYGQSMEQKLVGVKFTSVSANLSVDQVISEAYYAFTAKNFIWGE